MKPYILLFWLGLLLGTALTAQKTTGVIQFEEKMNMHRNLPPDAGDMRAMIPEFRIMKSELLFTGTESLYRNVEEEEDDTEMGGGGVMIRMQRPDAAGAVGRDLFADRQMHAEMQERIAAALRRVELLGEQRLAALEPGVILGMLLDHGGDLRLQRREHGAGSRASPGIEIGLAQRLARLLREHRHQPGALVLRGYSQRSAIRQRQHSGMRALQT